MYAYLEGTIIHQTSNYIILKTKDGVGYKVFISPTVNCQPSTVNSFYLYHYIKEDRQDLYGFKTPEELEIFETLISISGVGPKTAFTITSQFSAQEIKCAIEKDDVSFFQGVKGLGKKTASKIILELKGKLIRNEDDLSSPKNQETIDALVCLGYQKKDLTGVISQLPIKCETTQEKVKWILKNIK